MEDKLILAIDPGNELSAYAILDEDNGLKLYRFGKIPNEELLNIATHDPEVYGVDRVAIEMVACYGMPVGKEVFETCVMIGRLAQALTPAVGPQNISYVYRKDEKMNLCHTMKAKDANIRQALIDRFGPVGTKKNPGWFYGVSKDVWAAVAVGTTYYDMYIAHEKA